MRGRCICIPTIVIGVIGIEVSETAKAPWCTQARRGRWVIIACQPRSDILGHEWRHLTQRRAGKWEQVTENEASRDACCEGKSRGIFLP